MEEIVEEEEVNVSKGGVVELHNNISNNNNTVEIILRTIGPARPSRLRVPSPIKVRFIPPFFLFPSLFINFHSFKFFNLKFANFLYILGVVLYYITKSCSKFLFLFFLGAHFVELFMCITISLFYHDFARDPILQLGFP